MNQAFNKHTAKIVSEREFTRLRRELLNTGLTEEEQAQRSQYHALKPKALQRVAAAQFVAVASKTWTDDEGKRYVNGLALAIERAANNIAYAELSEAFRAKVNRLAEEAFDACTDYNAEVILGAIRPLVRKK